MPSAPSIAPNGSVSPATRDTPVHRPAPGRQPPPALSFSKWAFRSALDNPTTDHGTLGAIVALDPGLTVRLLQALSASRGPQRDAVLDPRQIIGLLGMDTAARLVDSAPTLEERFKGRELAGLRQVYSRALHAACFARALSAQASRGTPEDEAVLALLQSLGMIGLWIEQGPRAAFLEASVMRPEALDLLAEGAGIAAPADLGAELAADWCLPPPIARAQYFHNSDDVDLQVPLLASALSWAVFSGWSGHPTEELTVLAADYGRMAKDAFRRRLQQESLIAGRAACDRHLPAAAANLLLLPCESGGYDPSTPAPARIPGTPVRPGDTAPSERTRPPDTSDGGAPSKRLNTSGPATAPRPAATTPAAALPQRVDRLLTRARADLRLSRILLAMPTRDRTHICGRFASEASDSGLLALSVPAESRNLFSLLLDRPAALRLDGDNRERYRSLVPSDVRERIQADACLLVTVMMRRKPVGVLYADAGGAALDETQWTAFKQFATHLGRLLEGARRTSN